MVWSKFGDVAGNAATFAGDVGNTSAWSSAARTASNAVKGLASYAKPVMGFLSDNKDGINALANMGGAYLDYKSTKLQQDYAKHQMDLNDRMYADSRAEQQRQVRKEEDNTSAVQDAYTSVFTNPNRKKRELATASGLAGTNYTAAAGY